MVVCSKESTFSCPGIKYGIFCTTPGIALTRSIKSPKLALEMLLTGRNITAEEALNYGMVNKVVESSKLEEETLKLAESIISNSAEILAIGKQAFYEQIEKNLEDAYTFGEKVMLKNLETDDSKEGINAFIEKRLPKWKH